MAFMWWFAPIPNKNANVLIHTFQWEQGTIWLAICLLASTGTFIKLYTNVINQSVTPYSRLVGGSCDVIGITKLCRCGSIWWLANCWCIFSSHSLMLLVSLMVLQATLFIFVPVVITAIIKKFLNKHLTVMLIFKEVEVHQKTRTSQWMLLLLYA